MQIDSYIAVTKAKAKLLDMIRNIDDRDDTIAITKNGIPKAVIMSMEQYEAMCETMAIMADEERPLQNAPFCPISASGSNFNPQNTQCIPAVKIFAFLELEQN